MSNLTDLVSAMTLSEVRTLLESGPTFINKAEQIIFTTYTIMSLIFIMLPNGLVVGLVLADREIRTPYFIIMLCSCIYGFIAAPTLCLATTFISLTGYNPFIGSRAMCLAHRFLTFTAILSHCHNMSLLAAERVLFFYFPFRYATVVTTFRVIVFQVVIFVLTLTFNVATALPVQTYWSVSGFICAVAVLRWVLLVQMVAYYFFSILIVMLSSVALQVLVVKQRRAITSQTVQVSQFQGTSHAKSSPGIGRDGKNGMEIVSDGKVVLQSDGRALQSNASTSAALAQDSVLFKVKAATKLLMGVSGVFWLTLFPSFIGTAFIYSRENIVEIELGIAVKNRILRRLWVYFPFMYASFNPIIFLYVNPQLKKKIVKFYKRYIARVRPGAVRT